MVDSAASLSEVTLAQEGGVSAGFGASPSLAGVASVKWEVPLPGETILHKKPWFPAIVEIGSAWHLSPWLQSETRKREICLSCWWTKGVRK